jgi:molybdenum cofactor cytidylyltransferase
MSEQFESAEEGVPAILLAAGFSRRWGSEDKLLADVAGMPMLRRTAEALRGGGVGRLWIICRPEQERPFREILPETWPLEWVINPDAARGMGTSIRAGVSVLPKGIFHFLIAPGDLPWLEPAAVRAVIRATETARAKPVVPTFQEVPGHPVAFPVSWTTRLRKLPDDRGAASLWKRDPCLVSFLPLHFSGVCRDLDQPGA